MISIRTAEEGDLEAVARLHYVTRDVSLPYLPRLRSLEQVLCSFPGVLRALTVLVAERDGKIVAYCAFSPGWIDHLYVHPSHQSRGIGSALLAEALREAGAVKLWTFQRNRDAIRFYERHGFTLVRTTQGENEECEPDALYEKHFP